ncbi:MAG: TolC family protein [Leptospirales bacterium]|nr:TolC family protein [Leptospirales bacterium]
MQLFRRLAILISILFLTAVSAQDPVGPVQDEIKTDGPDIKQPTVQKTEKPKPAETASPSSPAPYGKLPVGPDGKPLPLSLEQIVKMVLENNNLVRIQQLEILKSDTDLMKDESKYAPKIGGAYEGYQKKDKTTPGTLFSGDRVYQDKYSAYVNKLFSSGTYFQIEASDTRFDSNAGESAAAQGTLLAQLAQPPLHTSALTFTLRQELMKNAFGYSQRRINDISRNRSIIQREELTLQLSQLVVKTMVDYWSLAIAEENVRTAELLLTNTRNIRDITYGKTNLGLAEAFEINQWNALTAQAENQLAGAILDRNSKKRELLRTLNLDPALDLTGAGNLEDKLPTDIDEARDIGLAKQTRPDLRNIRLQMENAQYAADIADNGALPSMSVAGKYASRDNGRHARTAWNEVPNGTYPESGVEFRVEMPLWDEGNRVDIRNAKIAQKQLLIQQRQLERQIEDEVRDGWDRIKTAHEGLKRAQAGVEQMNYFYGGLLVRYRQGRFTAVAVKNALDSLVQAQLALTQARINFNISLVRYELTRNTVFQKYNVDINEVLDRLKKD